MRSGLFFAASTALVLVGCRPDRRPASKAPALAAPSKIEDNSAKPGPSTCDAPQALRVIGAGPHGEPQVEQFVQCNPQRLHVQMPQMLQEWLFVRDLQDPTKVSGFLVLHRRKAIVHYPSERLIIEGVAPSWNALVSRLEQGRLASEPGVQTKLLQEPQLRFPDYRVWSFDAWSSAQHAPPEGHHHGPGGHHHGHGHDHGHGEAGHGHGHGEQERGLGEREHGHGEDGHEHGHGEIEPQQLNDPGKSE